MSTSRKPPDNEQIARVYGTLAHEHLDAQERMLRARTWQRLEQRIDQEPRGVTERLRAWLSNTSAALRDAVSGARLPFGHPQWRLAFSLALLVGVSTAVYRNAQGELHYDVIGAQTEGDWVRSGETPALLQFSDGSELQLSPESRLSVHVTGRRSAIARLSQGDVRVDVKHADETDWRFFAGPYEVRVIGTKFDLSFRNNRFSVAMREGQVRVISPREERTLRAGEQVQWSEVELARNGESTTATEPRVDTDVGGTSQRQTAGNLPGAAQLVNPRSGAVNKDGAVNKNGAVQDGANGPVADGAFEQPSGARQSQRPSLAQRRGARGAAQEAALGSTQSNKLSWRQMLSRGEFAALLAAAKEQGIDAAIQSRGSDDLVALAQAARYEKELGLARKVWTGVRSRFAGNTAGRDAAFFLARIAEQSGDTGNALELYASYLRETRRSGSYAPEALGRRLVILRQTNAGAEADARAYLAQFPTGPYAKLARELLDAKQSRNATEPANHEASSSSAGD